jgi:hypothetical protein
LIFGAVNLSHVFRETNHELLDDDLGFHHRQDHVVYPSSVLLPSFVRLLEKYLALSSASALASTTTLPTSSASEP